MITLVAIICHGILCIDVAVPTEIMTAGKANDPIPYTMSWVECTIHGQQIALDWINNETKEGGQYADWVLKSLKCVPGHYEPSKGA